MTILEYKEITSNSFKNEITDRLLFWPRFGYPSVCLSPKGVYVCHFLGQMLGCAYTICSNGQI